MVFLVVDIVVTSRKGRKKEDLNMKKATVDSIVKGIEVVQNSSDFAVVDGKITFTGFVGKKGYRGKLGDSIIRVIAKNCEVRLLEDTKLSSKGLPYPVASIDTTGLKPDDITYLIDLANKAMKKNAEDYKASKKK